MSRSFTIDAIYRSGKKINFDGGRYISPTPSSAAKKAFTNAYNFLNGNGKMMLEIHIRETTQDSNKKIYKYKVSRVKNITEVTINGKTIIYTFTTKIKAL